MSSSGPIVPDRLWYRLNASSLDARDPVDRLGPVDVRTDDDAAIGGRLTWQASPRNKLGFEFDRQRQGDGLIDLSAMTGPNSASSLGWTQRRSTIAWVAPYSPSLLVEAVVDLTDAESSVRPARIGTNACVAGPLAGAACLDLAVGELSGPVHRRVADDTRRLGVTTRFEYYSGRHWGAAHTVRGGLEWSADRYRRVLDREASLTRTIGAAWTARIAPAEVSDGTADARRWGLWAEDGIEFRHDLVLTVGVRVEGTRLDYVGASSVDPSDELRRFLFGLAANPMAPAIDIAAAVFTGYEEVEAFLSGIDARLSDPVDCGALCWQRAYDVATRTMRDRTIESTSWSPNAQLAWDPFRTNKTKLFIGFDRRHGDFHDSLALAGRDPATSDLLVELGAPGVSAAPGAVASVNAQVVSASVATPYVDEWVMGFKREVAAESSITVERIRRNGRRQLRSTDLNHRTGDFGRCVGGAVVPIFGGDGELDDCTGPQGVPDGILDSYLQNPLWGDLIEIDSNGRSTYDGWQLTFERRQYRGWWFKAAYTYARHEGDGDPFNPWLGDERGLVEGRWGPQSDDVRHQVKASGSWISPWGFRFGGTLRYASGTPYTNYSYTLTPDVLPPGMDGVGVAQLRPRLIYVEGRNSLRADDVLNLDLRVTREMNLGRGVTLQWYVEVFNAFEQRALIVQNVLYDQGRSIDGLLDGRRRNGRSMTTGLRLVF
jgi:hypothetical protein